MRLRSPLALGLLLALLALAAPARAQTPFALGTPAAGRLDASDALSEDSARYDVYTLRLEAGRPVAFTLRSDDYDAYLVIGTGTGAAFTEVVSADDGGGGAAGLDSYLFFVPDETTTYTLRASTITAGATGAYRLEAVAVEATPAQTVALTLAPGVPLERAGELALTDGLSLDDGSRYDEYRFDLPANTLLLAAAGPDDLGATLTLLSEGEGEPLGGGEGALRYESEVAGPVLLRVGAAPGTLGAYTLSLDARVLPPVVRTAPVALRAGADVAGALALSDPKGDRGREDFYTFEGRTGETVTLRASRVNEPPPTEGVGEDEEGAGGDDLFLEFGVMDGETFVALASDDDSGGSLNPLVTQTLRGAGRFHVRVTSLNELTADIPYRIAFTSAPGTAAPAYADGGTLRRGASATGTVKTTPTQATGEDEPSTVSTPVLYRLDGAGGAGGAVTLTLRSAQFDAYVRVGRLVQGYFVETAGDDDGLGEGTDARLETTLDGAGPFYVLVNSFNAMDGGAFTLNAE